MTKLICPECRLENEPERIYCHECGARLDRSALAKAASQQEDPQATHRRVKAMFDARGLKFRRNFFQLSKLILGALAVAAVVQMLRAPDLPEVPKDQMLPRQISLDLENAAMNPRTPPLRYSEAEVNAYLAYTLKSKQVALSKWLNFERAVADLDEGSAGITVERSLFGFSMFTSGWYAMGLQNGAVSATARAGKLGRLPLHPALLRYAGPYLFGDLATALDRDRKNVTKLGGIELHPQVLGFIPRQQ